MAIYNLLVQNWAELAEFKLQNGKHLRFAVINFKISGKQGAWSSWNFAQSDILLLAFYDCFVL